MSEGSGAIGASSASEAGAAARVDAARPSATKGPPVRPFTDAVADAIRRARAKREAGAPGPAPPAGQPAPTRAASADASHAALDAGRTGGTQAARGAFHHDAADREKGAPQEDPLDPSARRAAQLAPPLVSAPLHAPAIQAPPPASGVAAAYASLETLLPALVKRIAWSGDARRGTVRLELGSGSLAGGALLIEATDGRVNVRITAPAGAAADAEAWRARIERRLRARGLDVAGVRVE